MPNKRCAIVGTGASGVQITQAWGPTAKELKVFQRTPNLTVPMRQRTFTKEEQDENRKWYPELFAYRERCFGGFIYDFCERATFEDSPQEQEAFLEKLWQDGGFRYWLGKETARVVSTSETNAMPGNYRDYLLDAKSNRVVYDFWQKKQAARIKDPRKRDILVPKEPPHPWEVKVGWLQSIMLDRASADAS